MTKILPDGYLTILGAADLVAQTIFAGKPDSPLIAQLRERGDFVQDGNARTFAIEEIWNAVDRGKLRALAIGGRPAKIVRLDPETTKSIPTLRSPHGRGFALLRTTHEVYPQLESWFGTLARCAHLAFDENEVQKLAQTLMRKRRVAERSSGEERPRRGRPSLIEEVKPVLGSLIDGGKWNATRPLKGLTREVNRIGKWSKIVSEDTVIRALDLLYEQTGDRRFDRVGHRRRPSENTLKLRQ